MLALALALVVPAIRPAAAQSAAGWPGLTVRFLAPTGTAGPTDDVDVWLRLALAPDAQAFTFDAAAGGPDFGLTPGFLPTTGRVPGTSVPQPFAHYTTVRTAAAFGCDGATFGGPAARDGQPVSCRAATYRFTFAEPPTAAATFTGRSAFTLRPGETFDFLFGTFHPDVGPAPLGTYTLRGAAAQLYLAGTDAQNRPVTAFVTLATTCVSLADAACQTFTREVVAAAVVPEPGTAALAGAGLVTLSVVGAARRRRGVAG